VIVLFGSFGVAAYLSYRLPGGGLWDGLAPAIAANNPIAATQTPAAYDLTQLKVVNEVLKTVRDRYVDPKRVRPKEMLLWRSITSSVTSPRSSSSTRTPPPR
jgi:carboxyl-terminal processing protease